MPPVHKTKGGFKWGKSGKTYPTKAGAERQARAIYASCSGRWCHGYRGDSVKRVRPRGRG